LLLLCEGFEGDEIAGTLFISRHTVRTHVHRVLEKLGVHSRLEAQAFVMKNGLLDHLRSFSNPRPTDRRPLATGAHPTGHPSTEGRTSEG
jgi:Bacterial regulatory proteins, luxR family